MEIITEQTFADKTDFFWRELEGVRVLVCAPLEQDGFANGFSTRLGGVSPMPHDALNLAGFNEDPAEHILENRRRFLKLFSGQWTLTGCWQVHGADVRLVKDESAAQPDPNVLGDAVYCDALVSNVPRILLGVKTADCVPILIGDSRTGAFAAVHAGWRGTVASIVVGAVRRLVNEYGAQAVDLLAPRLDQRPPPAVMRWARKSFQHSESVFRKATNCSPSRAQGMRGSICFKPITFS